MNAKQLLIKARSQLVLDAPFFGSLALRLALVEDAHTDTAYTDGQVLGYNPAFIAGLTMPHVKALVAHEVMHLACLHHTRRKNRHTAKWNIAADHAINGILVEAGFTLPEGALLDACYANRSAEFIYDQLPDPPDGQMGYYGFGEVRDSPAPSGGDVKAVEAGWKVAITQAAQQAKAIGNVPGGVRRLVDSVVTATVDWRELLRLFIEKDARSDYAWLPPNRRWLSSGICMPGLHSKEPGQVVVAVDTSGSIDDQLLARFSVEVSGLLEDYDTTIHVIYCDTRVQGVQTFEHQDLPLKLNPQGGGGTNFRPVFDWVAEQNLEPCCLAYLTDLQCSRFPQSAPEYPVLWLCTEPNGREVPFGQVVEIN